MHLDTKALDFDLVVRLCREYQMASALIYFYNTGRDDYMTPLDFLFESLGKTSKASASSSSSSLLSPPRAMGLRALLYISLALHGNRFPTGVIPPARQQKVKMDILGYLFSGKLERVKTLIQFDSRETFRCLIGAMEDKSLTEWHGKVSYGKKARTNWLNPHFFLSCRLQISFKNLFWIRSLSLGRLCVIRRLLLNFLLCKSQACLCFWLAACRRVPSNWINLRLSSC